MDGSIGSIVTLGTAHPSKFPIAVEDSINIRPDIPERLKKIMNKSENFSKMEIDLKKIKNFISKNIK
jgi:threonine synthase